MNVSRKPLRTGSNSVAVAVTQTGGQRRATNYPALIKQGLKNAGFGHIPTIAVAFGGVYQNEQTGFKLPIIKIFNIGLSAFFFGDILNQIFSAAVVREKERGKSQQLFDLNRFSKFVSSWLIKSAIRIYNSSLIILSFVSINLV